MDNQDNPFFNMLSLMRIEGIKNLPFSFFIGKVINNDPLLIKAGDMQLDRDDIRINTALLRGSTKSVNIEADNVTGDVETEHGGTLNTFNMIEGKVTNMDNDFIIGDEVVLLLLNEQFILICKVR